MNISRELCLPGCRETRPESISFLGQVSTARSTVTWIKTQRSYLWVWLSLISYTN